MRWLLAFNKSLAKHARTPPPCRRRRTPRSLPFRRISRRVRTGSGCAIRPSPRRNALRPIEKGLQPAFGYYDKALHRPAICGRCGAEDFRFIYAGNSKAFEGCLGCYCFTCGYGISSNRTLNKRLPGEELGDLFALFRRWESLAADPAQTPMEANVASTDVPPVPVEPVPQLDAPAGTPPAT